MNNTSNSFSDKPIFIVCAARSGTTLLQYMLRSHPQLSFPTAESHFIIPFYIRRHEFGDLSELANLQALLENIYKVLARPLQKNNQNKWKNSMSAKQLNIFKSVAGDTLKDCGYKLACHNPSINKWDWFSSELEIKLSHLYSKYLVK